MASAGKNLSVVGKISGVYKATTANVPEIPNFPIMLNVILAGMRETSPANITVRHTQVEAEWCNFTVSSLPSMTMNIAMFPRAHAVKASA